MPNQGTRINQTRPTLPYLDVNYATGSTTMKIWQELKLQLLLVVKWCILSDNGKFS